MLSRPSSAAADACLPRRLGCLLLQFMRLFSYAKRAFSLRGSVRMASMASKEAPYGSWASPITAKFITSSSTGLSNVKVDAEGGLWWQESRPNEGGRNAVVRRAAPGHAVDPGLREPRQRRGRGRAPDLGLRRHR